jgi:hypothetical protein
MNLAGAVDSFLKTISASADLRTDIDDIICPWENKDVPILSCSPQNYLENVSNQIFDTCRKHEVQEYIFEAIMHVLNNTIEKYVHLQTEITNEMTALFDSLPLDQHTIFRCSKLLRSEQTLHAFMDKP